MELNNDLIRVQGILMSAVSKTGDFTKINHRGGNEQKILDILVLFQNYFSSKNYMKNLKLNNVFDKEIKEIVLFLVINTKYKNDLELNECAHLIGIVPQLSKCLLANLVYGLDLTWHYCQSFEQIPIQNCVELIEELVPCLKKSDPKLHLEAAYIILEAVINKLESLDYSSKIEDSVGQIVEVSDVILRNLTGLYSDQTKNWKAEKIYQHIGYSLLKMLKLLLLCDNEKPILFKFIENIMTASCSIMRSVTLNVFCTWAEIEDDDQPLQTIISGKAYLLIEKYQKFKPAKELISMLGTIAKKPKTIQELVQEADLSTIINKINKNDANQKIWFQALLNTQILKDAKAIKCASTWSHLSTEEDVTRLLNLSTNTNDSNAKKLVVKCASVLNLEDLISVSTRYFYKNGFTNILDENIKSQLTILFNKISENTDFDDMLIKEIYILLLQNPEIVYKYIYTECLKNSFHTVALKNTFISLKGIACIDNIGYKYLTEVIEGFKPNDQNVKYYITFFNMLKDIHYFSNNEILKILHILIEDAYNRECFTDLNISLQILSGINAITIKADSMDILTMLFEIMKKCRCKFLEFDNVQQDCTKQVVEILSCNFKLGTGISIIGNPNENDCFVTYYKEILSTGGKSSLLRHIYSEFNVEEYAESASKLIQLLPRCVTSEWLTIANDLNSKCSQEKIVELFTDVMILLCQLVLSQSNSQTETKSHLDSALKYCVQHYGIVLKEILSGLKTEVEISVATNVCRLLPKFPKNLQQEEGLTLANMIPEKVLKLLADNKEFICLVVAINNQQICQTIAQKMI